MRLGIDGHGHGLTSSSLNAQLHCARMNEQITHFVQLHAALHLSDVQRPLAVLRRCWPWAWRHAARLQMQ